MFALKVPKPLTKTASDRLDSQSHAITAAVRLENSLAASRDGQPLEGATRTLMERKFGRDFSDVRVHVGEEPAASARAMNARAYTSGRNIVFGEGSYSPATRSGQCLLAHELAHVLQRERHSTASREIEDLNSPAEHEAEQIGRRVGLGLPAGPVGQSLATVALTPASSTIEPLISYSIGDWEVTDAEEAKVVAALRGDPDVSATVTDLNHDGMLGALIKRVDGDTTRRELLQILGSKTNPSARALVEPHVAKLEAKWQLQFNLGRLGVTSAAPAFNAAPYAGLVSPDPSKPFTGSGATGVSPTTLKIPLGDQWRLYGKNKDPATVAKYSNPVPGSLSAYLSGLSATDRSRQAQLLLQQQITSVDAASYQGKIPSRAQVIAAAAKEHKLKPQHLAAFLLAEQRDQSKNEDAKDYLGATSRIAKGNTSIGLGQVVVSTAQNNDLFQDLLSSGTRGGLSHNDVARLLASDEYNILAAARYIRKVADDGAKIGIATLPNTKAAFPGIDMPAFAADSSTWPDDNLRALASEYTSRAWDDSVSEGWAFFVFEAYRDVVASGVAF